MATTTSIKINESGLRTPTVRACPEVPYGPERPLGSLGKCAPSSLKPVVDSDLECLSFSTGGMEGVTLGTRRATDGCVASDSDGFTQFQNFVCREFEEPLCGGTVSSRPDSSNPYAVLEDVEDDDCSRRTLLRKAALTLVRKISQFLGIPTERDLPTDVRCGELRTSIRKCFPSELSPLAELSIKTTAKVEKSACHKCMPSFMRRLDDWEEARTRPVSVDESELESFKRMFRCNVKQGWDEYRRPFIPNGHATLNHTRKEGGNWNKECFSELCEPKLVFSSGKPRVVTLYSSYNTSVLAPLHYSLYSCLGREGWLLQGSPTSEHIGRLNGSRYISVDYEGATDNIKLVYVRAAIEILISKASKMTDDEARCLRVLGDLQIEGKGTCHTGQPMGSVFSFPLLCLINKTVVDLALLSLLEERRISYKEFATHRLFINGDDLVTREPRSTTDLRERIAQKGSSVGLRLNYEKTMVHETDCEINSTFFSNGSQAKKTNFSSFFMDSDVEDVLGLALEATTCLDSFRQVVRANCHILSKQQDKHLYSLPYAQQMVCRKDRKIRRALTSLPQKSKPAIKGVIKMVSKPDGYSLERDLENVAWEEEIESVRSDAIEFFSKKRTPFRTTIRRNAASFNSLLKRPITSDEVIPKCLVRAYEKKLWDACDDGIVADPGVLVLDESRIHYIQGLISGWKAERTSSKCVGITFDHTLDYIAI